MMDHANIARLVRERERALSKLEPKLSAPLRDILRAKLAYERDVLSSFASVQEKAACARPPALAPEFFVKTRLESPLI